jgi:pyruvate formate lyase activating enzyme
MTIGGLQKTTLIDYPGKVACTVFLVGCNFRCPFCYAIDLVLPERIEKTTKISEKEFFSFLSERKGLLEGVVICGGEPTLNANLVEFITEIKALGFLVKLDTNGSNPVMLRELIAGGLIDYVAMDIKTCKEKYTSAVGVDVDISKIQESIDMLKEGKVDYEFRTTVVPDFHSKEDIVALAKWIGPAKRYYLQNFMQANTIDPSFSNKKPYPKEWFIDVGEKIKGYFESVDLRV